MRVPIRIDEQRPEPLYLQIENQLRGLILGGQLAEGALLPSIREMAASLKCSAITVRRVYQDLENEGLIRTRQGQGTYVSGVEADARKEYRMERVTEAFEWAVETGLQLGCTPEEMAAIVRRILSRYAQEEREGQA